MRNKIPEEAKAYFQTWNRFEYKFRNDDQRHRFEACCLREVKPLYHFEILDMLVNLGVPGYEEGMIMEPRSVYKPELLYPACKKWELPHSFTPNKIAYAKAVKQVREDFRCLEKSTRPISLYDSAFRLAFRPDGQRKSSGLPYLKKKDDVVVQTAARAKHVLRGKAPEPCLGIHRGKKRNECRLVWAYPYEMATIEGMYSVPLMENLLGRNGQHPIAYVTGKRQSNHCRIDRARIGSEKILCLDYSAFDSTIGCQLLTSAWSIVRTWFTEVDDKAWDRIQSYFATSPILMPDGYVYAGRRGGVPSGSCFTQIIDSVVNSICIRYIEQRLALKVTTYGVLGDDSYIGIKFINDGCDTINLQAVRGVLAELGIRLNVEKSEVRESNAAFHFLGVSWDPRHTVQRPLDELLHRIMCPEKWHDKPQVRNSEGGYTPEYISWFRARIQPYCLETGANRSALAALADFPKTFNYHLALGDEPAWDWKSWWYFNSKGITRMSPHQVEKNIVKGFIFKDRDYVPRDQSDFTGTPLICITR